MKYKHTDNQLQEAVATSFSIRQVLNKLSIVPAGGNYVTVQQRISRLGLDTSHFTGSRWNKGKILGPKRSITEYTSNNLKITSHKLRKRLLQEGVFPHQCQSCKKKTWLNKPIPLELHHKDGDHNNNVLENLSLLCPNCHSLTPNFRGKNRRVGQRRQ